MITLSLLIIVVIIFLYPIEIFIKPDYIDIFEKDYNSNDKLIKGFGEVKFESYEEYKKIETDDVYAECYAIFFNEEQANIIEKQINCDESWTSKPFNEKIINNYKKLNINDFGQAYYYIIEFDKDYNTIEINQEILDSKKIEWYKSAIYDSDNKTLYYYYRHYEK